MSFMNSLLIALYTVIFRKSENFNYTPSTDTYLTCQKYSKQCNNHALHKTLIKVSQDLKTQIISQYSKYLYGLISIDDGEMCVCWFHSRG